MFAMPWIDKDRERERFYLLPGMGGKAARRKRRQMLIWGISIGLCVSAALAFLLYAMSAR